MNGALPRPVLVVTTGDSLLSSLPLPLESYAAPPTYVKAYSFVVASVHAGDVESVVVVKNTISPATVGALVGRSPLVIKSLELDETFGDRSLVKTTVPLEVPSFTPYSLNAVPCPLLPPPGAVFGSMSLPVPKNR